MDALGALQHVIYRGIERRKSFWEVSLRDDFLKRLETILGETQTPCYAWALLPNHFHLLLRTGSTPIARVVRQLLSGYAGRFNRLQRRSGQSFKNRYKSILCQEEPYLLELVRYIHLNPLRTGGKSFMLLGHSQFRHDGGGRIEIAWNQPVGRNPGGLPRRSHRCRQPSGAG